MDDEPKNPRVIAMLGALFGEDWRDRLNGDVAFESGPMASWVYAVERMLAAADAADALRSSIRALARDDDAANAGDSSMPALR